MANAPRRRHRLLQAGELASLWRSLVTYLCSGCGWLWLFERRRWAAYRANSLTTAEERRESNRVGWKCPAALLVGRPLSIWHQLFLCPPQSGRPRGSASTASSLSDRRGLRSWLRHAVHPATAQVDARSRRPLMSKRSQTVVMNVPGKVAR